MSFSKSEYIDFLLDNVKEHKNFLINYNTQDNEYKQIVKESQRVLFEVVKEFISNAKEAYIYGFEYFERGMFDTITDKPAPLVKEIEQISEKNGKKRKLFLEKDIVTNYEDFWIGEDKNGQVVFIIDYDALNKKKVFKSASCPSILNNIISASGNYIKSLKKRTQKNCNEIIVIYDIFNNNGGSICFMGADETISKLLQESFQYCDWDNCPQLIPN